MPGPPVPARGVAEDLSEARLADDVDHPAGQPSVGEVCGGGRSSPALSPDHLLRPGVVVSQCLYSNTVMI